MQLRGFAATVAAFAAWRPRSAQAKPHVFAERRRDAGEASPPLPTAASTSPTARATRSGRRPARGSGPTFTPLGARVVTARRRGDIPRMGWRGRVPAPQARAGRTGAVDGAEVPARRRRRRRRRSCVRARAQRGRDVRRRGPARHSVRPGGRQLGDSHWVADIAAAGGHVDVLSNWRIHKLDATGTPVASVSTGSPDSARAASTPARTAASGSRTGPAGRPDHRRGPQLPGRAAMPGARAVAASGDHAYYLMSGPEAWWVDTDDELIRTAFPDPLPAPVPNPNPNPTPTSPATVIATGFEYGQGVATDAAGKVYVAHKGGVTKYSADGAAEKMYPLGEYTHAYDVAVDGRGSIYVLSPRAAPRAPCASSSGETLWTGPRFSGSGFGLDGDRVYTPERGYVRILDAEDGTEIGRSDAMTIGGTISATTSRRAAARVRHRSRADHRVRRGRRVRGLYAHGGRWQRARRRRPRWRAPRRLLGQSAEELHGGHGRARVRRSRVTARDHGVRRRRVRGQGRNRAPEAAEDLRAHALGLRRPGAVPGGARSDAHAHAHADAEPTPTPTPTPAPPYLPDTFVGDIAIAPPAINDGSRSRRAGRPGLRALVAAVRAVQRQPVRAGDRLLGPARGALAPGAWKRAAEVYLRSADGAVVHDDIVLDQASPRLSRASATRSGWRGRWREGQERHVGGGGVGVICRKPDMVTGTRPGCG